MTIGAHQLIMDRQVFKRLATPFAGEWLRTFQNLLHQEVLVFSPSNDGGALRLIICSTGIQAPRHAIASDRYGCSSYCTRKYLFFPRRMTVYLPWRPSDFFTMWLSSLQRSPLREMAPWVMSCLA